MSGLGSLLGSVAGNFFGGPIGGAIGAGLGGFLGGGDSRQTGTANSTQTIQIDPRLAALYYGYTDPTNPANNLEGLNSIANGLYKTNAFGPNLYVPSKQYALADRATGQLSGTPPEVGAGVPGADIYASTGRNMAPQMQAANTGYRSMFNPYISGTEAALSQNAIDYLQRSLLPSIQSSAISAGGYGGDRQALAEGLAAGEVGKGLLGQMANLRQQGYESDQSRALQNAITNAGFQQQAGANNQQAGLTGMGYGLQARGQDIGLNTTNRGQDLNYMLDAFGKNQAANANAANLFQTAYGNESSAPWYAANQYKNLISGFPGGQTQTTSQPVYTSPFGNALSGFLMGNALFGGNSGGNSLSGSTSNNNYYGGLSDLMNSIGSFPGSTISDRRLKQNIERIGTHASGLPWYRFDYVWGTPSEGVMADEVMAVNPDAVTVHPSGYLMVKYGAL